MRDMIPQGYPLFAVSPEYPVVFLVVGWLPTDRGVAPVTFPVGPTPEGLDDRAVTRGVKWRLHTDRAAAEQDVNH